MTSPIRILHLITGLNTGGAETMLWRMLSVIKDREGFQNMVVCLSELGPLARRIQDLNIPLYSLEMQPGKITPVDIFRLLRLIKREKVDLVQTWMYHADLVGGISARLAGNIPVIWGIHNSTVEPALTKKSTLWVIKICAALSAWLPAKIVSCSQRARDVHIKAGYKAEKFIFIPNGFDTQAFQPSPTAHLNLCKSLGIPQNAQVIGLIARFHPQKDIENFIKAAAIVNKNLLNAHFILCGEEMTSQNQELAGWIISSEIQNRIHLFGRRDDIPGIIAGLEVVTLSSAFGEAFPLVLGEAMSSGIPCVSTDVGDSAYLVGDTGLIVPPRDSQALAEAITSLCLLPDLQRQKLGEKARQRILDNFSLKKMVNQYTALYEYFGKNRNNYNPVSD